MTKTVTPLYQRVRASNLLFYRERYAEAYERMLKHTIMATNNGYSDWATTEIDTDIKSMWYRFSRREDDYCIECSEDSSFKATFTGMEITECKWLAHDGQAPDEE